MVRRTLSLAATLFISFGAPAQLTLKITGSVARPAGQWTDTVLVAFDVSQPVAGLRRVDPSGGVRTIHMVHAEHPAIGLKRALGPDLIKAGMPGALVMKVNRLHIEENGRRANYSLHAEIIASATDNPRRVFEAGVSLTERRCKDDTECHGRNVLKALSVFFASYEKARGEGTLTSVEIAVEDLSRPFAADASNSPILQTDAPKRGLYRSYMDMRLNRPDSLYQFELRESVRSIGGLQIVRVERMSDEVEEQYWGLSTGIHPYVRVGHEFYRLDRTEHGYCATVPQPSTSDPAAVMMGALFFGALGAGIVAATTTVPSPPLRFDLDMLCGDLVPRHRSAETSTFAQHIFHVTRFAKGDGPVTLRCDDLEARTLSKVQWTSYQLTPKAEPTRVVISNGTHEVTVDLDTNSDKVDVHLIDVKRDGSITVSKLKEQMRNSVIDDLKAEDRRN